MLLFGASGRQPLHVLPSHLCLEACNPQPVGVVKYTHIHEHDDERDDEHDYKHGYEHDHEYDHEHDWEYDNAYDPVSPRTHDPCPSLGPDELRGLGVTEHASGVEPIYWE